MPKPSETSAHSRMAVNTPGERIQRLGSHKASTGLEPWVKQIKFIFNASAVRTLLLEKRKFFASLKTKLSDFKLQINAASTPCSMVFPTRVNFGGYLTGEVTVVREKPLHNVNPVA